MRSNIVKNCWAIRPWTRIYIWNTRRFDSTNIFPLSVLCGSEYSQCLVIHKEILDHNLTAWQLLTILTLAVRHYLLLWRSNDLCFLVIQLFKKFSLINCCHIAIIDQSCFSGQLSVKALSSSTSDYLLRNLRILLHIPRFPVFAVSSLPINKCPPFQCYNYKYKNCKTIIFSSRKQAWIKSLGTGNAWCK